MLPEATAALCGAPTEKLVRWDALQWDSVAQYLAWRKTAHEMLRRGIVPLWNAHQGCGMPLLANPQVGVFYPLNILFWLMPVEVAIGWSAFLHTAIALLSSFWLARAVGISPLGSFACSISFAFSAPLITWQMLPSAFNTMCWLPCLMACIVAYLRQPVLLRLLSISVACLMLILSGHPQLCIYSLIAAIAVLPFTCTALRMHSNASLPSLHLLLVALSMALAVCISAAQLLPAAELAMYSHRSGKPTWNGYLWFSSRGMGLEDFAMLILPYAWGTPKLGDYIGKENFADYCPYVGIITLLFALAATASVRGSSCVAKRYSAAAAIGIRLALLGILLATGSPFNIPFYFALPGFAQIGTPTRAWFLSALGLALMCGVGIDRLSDEHASFAKVASLIAASLAMCAMCLLLVFSIYRAQLYGVGLSGEMLRLLRLNAGAVFALITLLLLPFLMRYLRAGLLVHAAVVAMAIELFLFGFGHNQALSRNEARLLNDAYFKALRECIPHSERVLFRVLPVSIKWRLRGSIWQKQFHEQALGRWNYDEWLRTHSLPDALFPPNLMSLVGLYDPQAYDSLMLRSYKALVEVVEGAHPCPPENGNMVLLRNVKSPLLKQLAVRYILVRKPSQVIGVNCEAMKQVGSLWLCEVEGALARVWIPKRIVVCRDGGQALDSLKSLAHRNAVRGSETAIVTCTDTSLKLAAGGWFNCSALLDDGVSVTVIGYGVGGVVLVLSDVFYPGWKVWLLSEGEQIELQLLPAQYALRCAALPKLAKPTELKLTFVYLPTSYLLGLFLSLSSLSMLIGLICFSSVRRRSTSA